MFSQKYFSISVFLVASILHSAISDERVLEDQTENVQTRGSIDDRAKFYVLDWTVGRLYRILETVVQVVVNSFDKKLAETSKLFQRPQIVMMIEEFAKEKRFVNSTYDLLYSTYGICSKKLEHVDYRLVASCVFGIAIFMTATRLIIINNLPDFIWQKVAWLRFRLFPPPTRRLLSEQEFIAEGARETRKALDSLRDYCRTPDSLEAISRLSSPHVFAEFVSGERSHFADDEVLRLNVVHDEDDDRDTFGNEEDDGEVEIIGVVQSGPPQQSNGDSSSSGGAWVNRLRNRNR